MPIRFDTDGVIALAAALDAGIDGAQATADDVATGLDLSELEGDQDLRLRRLAARLAPAADVLRGAAATIEQAELDLEAVAASLGVPAAELQKQIDALGLDADASADAILARLVTDFVPLPATLWELFPDLPPPGQDREVDAAVARLEPTLLPALLAGEPIDLDDLPEGSKEDLRVLTAALGGGDITLAVTTTEKYRGGRGDDEYRRVTRDVPITELGSDVMAAFLEVRGERSLELRDQAIQLRGSSASIDRNDLAASADELGLTEEELGLYLEATDIISRGGLFGIPSAAGASSMTESGDAAARLDRLAEIDKELGESANVQRISAATGASVSLAAGAPAIIVGLAGAFTTAVAAPVVAAAAVVGGAVFVVDVVAGFFGFTSTNKIDRLQKEREELELRNRQDDFNRSDDRRDNLEDEGHDPSIRDDDFSGDQNTGGNGLL